MGADLTAKIAAMRDGLRRAEAAIPFGGYSAADRERLRRMRDDIHMLEKVMAEPQNKRHRELGHIHALKRDLRLLEDDYRALISTFSRGRTRTAAEMDSHERRQLISHLESRRPRRTWVRHWIEPRITLPEGRRRMGKKVCAMLAARDRGHGYADAMAKHMFHVDRWEHLNALQLHDLVAALETDQRRRGETT